MKYIFLKNGPKWATCIGETPTHYIGQDLYNKKKTWNLDKKEYIIHECDEKGLVKDA
jgi:hypothetical protein